jgi:peptidoglycan/LPS O-acetylase OafA/YrhL
VTPPAAAARSRWWAVLTGVLAAGYLYVGATTPQPSIRWPALAGGLLVLAALWVATRSRPAALAALVAGAVVPAVVGWWSVVLPVTGLLILVCGTLAVRASTTRIGPRPAPSAP